MAAEDPLSVTEFNTIPRLLNGHVAVARDRSNTLHTAYIAEPTILTQSRTVVLHYEVYMNNRLILHSTVPNAPALSEITLTLSTNGSPNIFGNFIGKRRVWHCWTSDAGSWEARYATSQATMKYDIIPEASGEFSLYYVLLDWDQRTAIHRKSFSDGSWKDPDLFLSSDIRVMDFAVASVSGSDRVILVWATSDGEIHLIDAAANNQGDIRKARRHVVPIRASAFNSYLSLHPSANAVYLSALTDPKRLLLVRYDLGARTMLASEIEVPDQGAYAKPQVAVLSLSRNRCAVACASRLSGDPPPHGNTRLFAGIVKLNDPSRLERVDLVEDHSVCILALTQNKGLGVDALVAVQRAGKALGGARLLSIELGE